MAKEDRLNKITEILKTAYAEEDHKTSAEVEAYIASLDANQANRPSHVTEILKMIGSLYTTEVGTSLVAYIAELETKQTTRLTSAKSDHKEDTGNPPIWSHQRSVRRQNQRQVRAQYKRTSYDN